MRGHTVWDQDRHAEDPRQVYLHGLYSQLARQTSTWAEPKCERINLRNGSELATRIDEIAGLREGWDGEHAPAISPEAIECALRLAVAISPLLQAEVAPNPNGTVSFYLGTSERSAELEIGRTRYSWTLFSARAGARPTGHSGDISEVPSGPGIAELLRQLQGQLSVRMYTITSGFHPQGLLQFANRWRETSEDAY